MPHEKCDQHETFENVFKEIKKDLAAILERLGERDVDLATLSLRVKIMEMLVYGGVGIGLTALLVKVLSMMLGDAVSIIG